MKEKMMKEKVMVYMDEKERRVKGWRKKWRQKNVRENDKRKLTVNMNQKKKR